MIAATIAMIAATFAKIRGTPGRTRAGQIDPNRPRLTMTLNRTEIAIRTGEHKRQFGSCGAGEAAWKQAREPRSCCPYPLELRETSSVRFFRPQPGFLHTQPLIADFFRLSFSKSQLVITL